MVLIVDVSDGVGDGVDVSVGVGDGVGCVDGGDDVRDSPPPGLAGVEGPQSECNGWQGSPPARCPCRRTV